MSQNSTAKAASMNAVSAYLIVKDAKKALAFYEKAFAAEEQFRLVDPNGVVGHAEFKIGNTLLQLADEHPDFGALSPVSIGGCPVKFTVEVDDVEAAFQRAVDAGAEPMRKIEKQFYGYLSCMVADPFGYSWLLQQNVDHLTGEEMQGRWAATFDGA
ncbi:VOC family protein [Kordiimonas aestuarii]|uniref:VOC family protein n=1 Tax=Kordiimonas aestuarii TaxID=1005925 RepID=UPI0021D35E5B|nr:VOC family protein [Kordiimonas aestuarii]